MMDFMLEIFAMYTHTHTVDSLLFKATSSLAAESHIFDETGGMALKTTHTS